MAALMFERNEYLFKFDLKSGYHHADIFPEHHKYLDFRWVKSAIMYYCPTILPSYSLLYVRKAHETPGQKKSQWKPLQCIYWLGFVIQGQFCVQHIPYSAKCWWHKILANPQKTHQQKNFNTR